MLLKLFTSDAMGMMDQCHTLTGFWPVEYALLLSAVQQPDFSWSADSLRMMTQALNNLSGYPHGQHAMMAEQYGLTADKCAQLMQAYFAAFHAMLDGPETGRDA